MRFRAMFEKVLEAVGRTSLGEKMIRFCLWGKDRWFVPWIAKKFHRHFYNHKLWRIEWLGVPCFQNPLDVWIKQEIIFETRPDFIVEAGTSCGGSALLYASLLETLGHGKVLTMDVRPNLHEALQYKVFKDRVRIFQGDSTSPELFSQIAQEVHGSRVLVFLDSDHSKGHVLKELRLYADLVSVGSYLVVEDTNVNGHPVVHNFGEGPFEAVQAFLAEDDRFQVDKNKERFLFTFNPSGYLKRIK